MGKRREVSVGPKVISIEVDVSGQLGVDGDTVFAFSDGEKFSVLIPAIVKKGAKKYYLSLGRAPGRFYFNLYICGLVLLLKEVSKRRRSVYLDWELYGHEGEVKGELLMKMSKHRIGSKLLEIDFRRVGKKSNAHLMAHEVYRRKKKPNKVVTLERLLKLLK